MRFFRCSREVDGRRSRWHALVHMAIDGVVDSLPRLVKALDEVAKLQRPFIGGTSSSSFMFAIQPFDVFPLL